MMIRPPILEMLPHIGLYRGMEAGIGESLQAKFVGKK
jgi:hypothetical protein